MKAFLVIVAAVALALVGWRLVPPDRSDSSARSHVTDESHVPPTTTNTDPTEVFQKAFWKRPTAADRILHAERREWEDADGVSKWQWCIEVEPSPALLKHLREDNAFGLLAGNRIPWEAPADWFPKSADGFTVMQSVNGSMTLLFGASGDRLYATSAGGGFRPGLPAPALPEPVQTADAGRIPLTPPPNPQR